MNKEIENIVSVLTADEQQLLKDILNMETGDYDDGGDCYFQSYEDAFSAGVSAILSKLTTN